ncbi:hypothetical protein Glove_67g64 [Diversispora epigaea]|uniref:BZIP domain-containing protein n=1 Tax=Diversispora epigaea TaxID=1348612 RepID=A0A397JH84_9GLOM|nr:hypothetical protein Glove_67g64 [Diversispora epigaea]
MENTHYLFNQELSALSPEQIFCNECFSFINELTIQDIIIISISKSQKRNREKYEGGEEEKIKREKKRESDRKSDIEIKKKNEAEKLNQQVNDLEEKNKFLKNTANQLSEEFMELKTLIIYLTASTALTTET